MNSEATRPILFGAVAMFNHRTGHLSSVVRETVRWIPITSGFCASMQSAWQPSGTPVRRLLATVILMMGVRYCVAAEGVHSTHRATEEPTAEFTLEDAVALAVRENRLVRSAYLERISQKFDLYVAEGKFAPKVTLTTSAQSARTNGVSGQTRDASANVSWALPTGGRIELSSSQGHRSVGTVSSSALTLTQPLLKNGGVEAGTASVRLAQVDEAINQLSLQSNLSQTVVQVIYAYRELLRAQGQRSIAEMALRRSKDLYDVNRALIGSGRMAEVEILQTEAEVANREVALEEAGNQVDAARLALLSLLALELKRPFSASTGHDLSLRGTDLDLDLQSAYASQPDYLIAKLRRDRAQISLDYARNQQLWDLSVVAGKTQSRGGAADVGSSIVTSGNTRVDSTYAGLQLSIPLGDRSTKQAEVHAAIELQKQQLAELQTRQVVEQRVRDAARNVQTRWRQLELSKKARDLSLLKLGAEKDKLQVGRSSNFQVLSFENDLRNAENARLNAETTYLNALTDLDERVGRTLSAWNIPIAEASSDEH